jgi:hypothetical protein
LILTGLVSPCYIEGREDGRHWLLIRRSLSDPLQKAYYFVFGPQGTTLPELVAAIGARWPIEEDFETAKDMGLDQYARPQLDRLVSPYHAGDAGACELSRDLCPAHPSGFPSVGRTDPHDS